MDKYSKSKAEREFSLMFGIITFTQKSSLRFSLVKR